MKSDFLHSQGTRRFLSFCISLALLTIIAGIAIVLDAKAELVVAVSAPITTIALGYQGFGSWHDKNTRVASIKADPMASQPPATTVSVRDSNVEVGSGAKIEGSNA